MQIITVDFETYYAQDFSLTKQTTEEYIRSPQFQVIGVGVKVGGGDTWWASGTHEQLKEYLQQFDWENSILLAHNTKFDGAILNWIFDIRPKVYADTLCMARALHGVEVGASLKALTDRYGIGAKGTEVVNAKGLRREDFSEEQLDRYGDYCVNDVELTYQLCNIFMQAGFPKQEMKIIDLTLRMFVEPMLDLDLGALESHLIGVKQAKEDLLEASGVDKKDLMSNPKFAELLRELGVVPPMKISATTGKEAYAFAKSDEAFKALEEHPDARVQGLVAARLGNKSTLEETRTQRFIDICNRGLLPVPVKYYAAHTGRWGGDDKINMQNLPSRGPNAKQLKSSIIAPEGYTIIDCDSSQIEARVLAWFAGQHDLVQAFANKEDVYKKMAATIYGVAESDVDKHQRAVGKAVILGAGYGMGSVRFQDQLRTFGVEIELDEARRIIDVYRHANAAIKNLWKGAGDMLRYLANGDKLNFGLEGVLDVKPEESGILLPSGLMLRYDGLAGEQGEKGIEYTYKTRRGRNRIYGGKVVENVCQALARCIIGEQMLAISERYRVVLTVHDSVVCCVPDEEVSEARAYIEECMRRTPDWAKGLPLDCESGIGKSYGECE